MPKQRPMSRQKRWEAACTAVRNAIEAAESAALVVEDAFEELREIQSEFEEWRDNMSENLRSTPVYEKLEAICDIDLEWSAESDSLDDANEKHNEAEGADLPLGFGRD